MRCLIEGGFAGKLYPVNPKTEEILGLRCYASINEIPSEADLEAELVAVGRRHGTLVIGPNVQGIASVPNRMSALMYPVLHLAGPLAVVGQNGSITAAIAEWAERDGLGISAVLNLGNEADVDESGVVVWLADELTTKVRALYLEGVRDGRRFVETAGAVGESKPVV